MSYAIVGILVIAFIAFVVLSAKAWHWANIVFLSLCFLAGLGALLSMGQVLELRRAEMLDARKAEDDLIRINQQIENTLYGEGLTLEYSPDSLRGLSERLDLELADRGRVWTGGSIEPKDANRIFRFSGPRVQNPDAVNQASMQDMRLFVFADRTFDNEQVFPVRFVGTMRVLGETDDSVELEPVFLADVEEYKSPTSTWTLYEKSPADRRDAYLRDTSIELKEEDSGLDQELTEYRKILVEEFLPANGLGFDLSDEQQAKSYELLIDRIMFDGLPIVKIENWIETQPNRISQRFVPESEEVFVRFRFENKSNGAFDVNSTGNLGAEGQFTENGQAINPALHAEGDIEFEKGDVIMVDQLTADGYQRGEDIVPRFSDTQPVTEIDRVFVRRLSDFPYLLKTMQRKYDDYLTEIQRVQDNNLRSAEAITKADDQSRERENQIQLLLADRQKFQGDVDTISRFANRTSETRDRIEGKLQEIQSEIRSRHREMKAIAIVFDNPAGVGTSISAPIVDQFAPPAVEQFPAPVLQPFPGANLEPIPSTSVLEQLPGPVLNPPAPQLRPVPNAPINVPTINAPQSVPSSDLRPGFNSLEPVPSPSPDDVGT